MKTRGWLILLFFSILLAGAAAFLLQKVHVLQIKNTDRPGRLLIRTEPSAFFSFTFIHSMYLEPATEEFEVGGGEEFLLRGVRTRSPAVAAYYGFVEGREYYPVNRKMDSFLMRLGMSRAQVLSYGDKKISLEGLGGKGDRLEVRVIQMPWGQYLLSSGKKERG
ncbi:MAG TPA: hypothetical protein VF372_05345 [Thermodesulfobacteriota bacterium]